MDRARTAIGIFLLVAADVASTSSPQNSNSNWRREIAPDHGTVTVEVDASGLLRQSSESVGLDGTGSAMKDTHSVPEAMPLRTEAIVPQMKTQAPMESHPWVEAAWASMQRAFARYRGEYFEFALPASKEHIFSTIFAEPVSKNDTATAEKPTFADVAGSAVQRAFNGGMAGFATGLLQVLCFMWLRTIMNRQYYSGGTLVSTTKALWEEGGIARFYQGLLYAVIDAPIARFGDTFANVGVLALLADVALHPMLKTVVVSICSASWRLFITPIDTLKTTMQVQGEAGMKILNDKISQGGWVILWSGALANFGANAIGNYPWWATYNTLDSNWPRPDTVSARIFRNGVMGICASVISDCISNSFRVLKTVRQAHPDVNIGYAEAAWQIMKTDGLWGLLGRGLGTRILTNVLQGTFFSIVWKLMEEQLNPAA